MFLSRLLSIILPVGIVLGVGTALMGANTPSNDDAARIRLAVAQGEVLPLPRILALAQHRVPGEVLKVELEEIGERLGYEVKVLTADGRVCEIRLDARSGAILAVQAD